MSASIRIKILGGTNILDAYSDCQIISLALGGVAVETTFNGVEKMKRGRENERIVYATKSDWLELMAKFEVLKAAYRRPQKSFYLAFLMANDLLTDPDDDAPEPTPEQEKAYKAASFMSLGIERTSLHPQLENMEG